MEIIVKENIFIRSKRNKKSRLSIWCIHGFPESSLSFHEAFESELVKVANVFAPDLPGFGVSPSLECPHLVQESVEKLGSVIAACSPTEKLGIITHSWGGILAVELAKRFKDRVVGYIDAEGPLSPSPYFFSEIAGSTEITPSEFSNLYISEQEKHFSSSEAFKRYFSSILFADHQNLLPWARECLLKIKNDNVGLSFLDLECEKVEFTGNKNPREKLNSFLKENNVPTQIFQNSGHWPMIDQPLDFYLKASEFFERIVTN